MPPPHHGPTRGARILLLDEHDRVLLLQVRDPDHPARTWLELPGGSLHDGETAADAGRRELAEETGIQLDHCHIQGCVWVRESRYVWQGHEHHRLEEIYLAHLPDPPAYRPPQPDALERQMILGQRWWTLTELQHTTQPTLPTALATRLAELLGGTHPGTPMRLREDTRPVAGGSHP